ncbi:MAG: alpha-glucosidase C-terminal domain-containing protein [Anaerolineales bacterium]|nr:alpha-glucosidase C-terminal domain-containing protein [Anaerolineales bacterium]MCB8961131.1 alpha-glucosidase C-terminal domain-containing protein [Ardenticatenales bacterium]
MNPGDRYQPTPYVKLTHPAWSKKATIYQINTRQFTPAGTFRAAAAQLPRLQALGVDIVWLMPVHEIGRVNRKGTLGSPYSVRDYYSVNPEFGTLDDLRHFIKAAHDLGLHVILDWVPNHTAWDNQLTVDHPEWYRRDWKGDFLPTPWWDWPDIIELDYSQPGLRRYMTDAMKYWVSDVDVDGFRCDVAGFVPTDFWNNLRQELDTIKPVFLLAEWESRDLHAEAFDMTYAWSWHDAVRDICQGKAGLDALFVYYSWNEKAYPADAFRMNFVSNHDKNAWDGTQFELFGDGLEAAIVLSVVAEGMPLLYNGQEAGNPRRLAFFEKDPIEWQEHPIGELYRQLFALKKENSALWNGAWGARMEPVVNDRPDHILSFVRRNAEDQIFAIISFSAQPQTVTFPLALPYGNYIDYFSQEAVEISATATLTLPPWGYRVFVK